MMFGLGFPWLLSGLLAAVPALWLIYKLRERTRRKIVVSSLFLWQHVQETRAGGQRLQRFQASWLFWLELLILCLLLLAAAAPTLSLKKNRGALMVVLDDSFSMLSGSGAPRRDAENALQKILQAGDYSFVRLILAGRSPQVLGGPIERPQDAAALLRRWRCMSANSVLAQAIALAWQMGGPRARLLVLTDHPPAHRIAPSRVRWWAFGGAQANVALTYAARVRIDQKDWCLLEITYFGKGSQRVVLTLQEDAQSPTHRTFSLSGGVPRRLRFALRSSASTFVASVPPDALPLDDRVTLLPLARRVVKVRVDLKPGAPRVLLLRTLQATKDVSLVTSDADLRWTEQPQLLVPAPTTWGVHWHDEGADVAYNGPFVVHQTHLISRGLSLRGAVWGAGQGKALPGLPLITAGDIPLLSVQPRPDGGQALHLRWRAGLSTLAQTPNWPILIWNIIHWRQASMPGIAEPNLRLGSVATLRTGALVERVQITPPGGPMREAIVHDARLPIPADLVGLYEIQVGQRRERFVVNALERTESDLRGQQTKHWGSWPARTERPRASVPIAWLLLLLALLGLGFHSWLSFRDGGQP